MAYSFYQLTSIDGTNKPLAYFRYDGKQADYWTGTDWQPSAIFYDKLLNRFNWPRSSALLKST